MDGKLDPSFRGRTDSQHVEDGIVVTFDHAIPDKWADKTIVYVEHPTGEETMFLNVDNDTPDTFSFKPFNWATLHVNLIKFEATKLRVQIVGEHKRPHIDLAPPKA